MKHGFRGLLQKNLLLLILPAVFILVAFVLVLVQISRLEHFQTGVLEDTSYAKEYFLSGQRNVEVYLDDLHSTGFVYVIGDKEEGEYFYRIRKGTMELILLTKSSAARVRNGLDGDTYRVRLIRDDATAAYIEQEYADAMGIARGELAGLGGVYLFDEVAYPRVRILLLRIALITLSSILVALMLYTVLAVAVPALNWEAGVLRRFGKRSQMIRRLDHEMEKHLKMHQDNVIITEKYMIVSYLTHIDVVRIDEIKYLSKHVEKRRRGVGRPMNVYRLTASNGQDMYFEADFFDEGIINDVIYYLHGESLLEYEEMQEQARIDEEERLQDELEEEQAREAIRDAERELIEQFDRDELDG